MDFYAIDSWVAYKYSDCSVVFSSSDAPLVSFGGPSVAARKESIEDEALLSSLVYDNTWDTNFPGFRHGIWSFEYDIAAFDSGYFSPGRDTADYSEIGRDLHLGL